MNIIIRIGIDEFKTVYIHLLDYAETILKKVIHRILIFKLFL